MFVALFVAEELGVGTCYAERFARSGGGLFPIEYRVPGALRPVVRGKRVAIANDVINAGSAVGGALLDLLECGAVPVAIGALLVLGDSAARLAAEHGVALEALASRPNRLWTAAGCPLCAAGEPLEDPAG